MHKPAPKGLMPRIERGDVAQPLIEESAARINVIAILRHGLGNLAFVALESTLEAFSN